MGFGLIGIGRNQADQAINGFGDVAKLETARDEAKKTMEAQKEVASSQMKGTMAGVGAMAGGMYAAGASMTGMAALGPVGLGIAGGMILSSLF